MAPVIESKLTPCTLTSSLMSGTACELISSERLRSLGVTGASAEHAALPFAVSTAFTCTGPQRVSTTGPNTAAPLHAGGAGTLEFGTREVAVGSPLPTVDGETVPVLLGVPLEVVEVLGLTLPSAMPDEGRSSCVNAAPLTPASNTAGSARRASEAGRSELRMGYHQGRS